VGVRGRKSYDSSLLIEVKGTPYHDTTEIEAG
jgi:hypothetical protein